MIPFLTDEDYNSHIVEGAQRRLPYLDIVRVQEVGLSGQSDPAVLEWAAQNGRVLLSHDVNTMRGHAYDRIRFGLPCPGLFLVSHTFPVAEAIEEIVLLAECSLEGEWGGQVRYFPL